MSDLSPEDVALLEAQVPVGLLMPVDETMRLVHVTHGVVEEHIGVSAESVTTTDGLVFWFDAGAGNRAVNRMATLNLLAASDFSARTVPLLRGAALVTGGCWHAYLSSPQENSAATISAAPRPRSPMPAVDPVLATMNTAVR